MIVHRVLTFVNCTKIKPAKYFYDFWRHAFFFHTM